MDQKYSKYKQKYTQLKSAMHEMARVYVFFGDKVINKLHDLPLTDANIVEKSGLKTKGLWYSPISKNHSVWFDFSAQELGSFDNITHKHFLYIPKCKYRTVDQIDPNGVLLLSTTEEVKKFSKLYGMSGPQSLYVINWKKVKENWAGIEFIPYYRDFSFKNPQSYWYGFIDIPSGCLWRPNKIGAVLKFDSVVNPPKNNKKYNY